MCEKSLVVFGILIFSQIVGFGQAKTSFVEFNFTKIFATSVLAPGSLIMNIEEFDYQVGDQIFSGVLANYQEENSYRQKPGILYFSGSNDSKIEIRTQIGRLARSNYVVFALSMYPKGTTQKTPLTAAQFNERVKEGLKVLKLQPYTDQNQIAVAGSREGASYAIDAVRSGLAVTAVGIDPTRVNGTNCSITNCKGFVYLIKGDTPIGGAENLQPTDPKSKDALRWNIDSIGAKAGFSDPTNPNSSYEIITKTEKLATQFLAKRFNL